MKWYIPALTLALFGSAEASDRSELHNYIERINYWGSPECRKKHDAQYCLEGVEALQREYDGRQLSGDDVYGLYAIDMSPDYQIGFFITYYAPRYRLPGSEDNAPPLIAVLTCDFTSLTGGKEQLTRFPQHPYYNVLGADPIPRDGSYEPAEWLPVRMRVSGTLKTFPDFKTNSDVQPGYLQDCEIDYLGWPNLDAYAAALEYPKTGPPGWSLPVYEEALPFYKTMLLHYGGRLVKHSTKGHEYVAGPFRDPFTNTRQHALDPEGKRRLGAEAKKDRRQGAKSLEQATTPPAAAKEKSNLSLRLLVLIIAAGLGFVGYLIVRRGKGDS